MRISPTNAPVAVVLVALASLVPNAHAGAQVRTLNVGRPPGDTTTRACLTDSAVAAALAAFNGASSTHVFGWFQVSRTDTLRANLGVFEGPLKLDGVVAGNVVVLNGDARVTRTGVVTGTITVLGGRLVLDPGATVGPSTFCDTEAALARRPNGTVAALPPTRSIGSVASGIGWTAGDYRITPHLGISQYNRVEALPIQIGANAARSVIGNDSARAGAYLVARSGRDPSGSRGSLGWHATASYTHPGDIPVTVTAEGGSTIDATADRPYTDVQSGLSAFLTRNDYTDWYQRRGGSIAITAQPTRELTFTGSFDISHETTVFAIGAFSLFRNTDPWRANPLIDDGTYRTMLGRVTWDARDPEVHPVLSWFVRAELRRVSSGDLTPVSLPTTIRDAMPSTGYAESEGLLDLRASLRLDPEQRVALRIFGAGYLSGDPLTLQRRLAVGSADPLLGYDFRGVNCDREPRPDPATPALCDRSAAIQAEYRRTLPVEVGTRINGYPIGVRRPDLVVFADAATAWLAGDSAGRVPTNRIESLREWRSDFGVGVTSGSIGLFLAKSLADGLPVRLTLLLTRRF